ncbi:General transcription factor IIH subunit 1 [Choanephora cucurbitarum]|uniref:General transcription factor IIH subunit 1 n=1 Tax=Choanephora cucurbitarum TaxID=101091 RepID=A0A1C7N4M3_9FUNG|nr:General transcription factor IIH subunit 1 [Choanephora cucurbitarum]
MWEPNEQLLLRAAVRYKKHEGTLFVTPRRVAWQQQGSSQLLPSIYYNDINSLAQTPETSARVLLKISIKPPTTKDYTFQFTSAKNIQEREAMKAQIAELLARTRGSTVGTPAAFTPTTSAMASPLPSTPPPPQPATPAGAAITNTPTIASPQLPQPQPAHKPAIASPGTPMSGAASPRSWRQEEFNDRRQLLTSSRELQTLHKELVVIGKSVDEEEFWSSPYVKRIRQKLKKDAVSREGKQKGKSSRMVELKPGQQEGSDVKYTLTSQIIHNIFTEFPSVKRAYDANVPDKMTEQAFWKRFLASEFFHRSRTGARSHLAPYDDIFDRCLQEEDDENSKPPSMTRMDKIRFDIDLSRTEEDHMESGNAPDFTMKPGREVQSLPLIRRFNRHSSRVLEVPLSKIRQDEASAEKLIEEEIVIKDLLDEPAPEKIVLDIQDTRRYFESQAGGLDEKRLSEHETKELLNGMKRKFEGWQPDMARQVIQPRVADRVCMELTNVIKRKIRHDDKSAQDVKLTPQLQQKIQSFHSATNEILRHFWSSFEPYKPAKNMRMIEGLRKQQEKIKELLATVAHSDGDTERCKQALMPVIQAVDRALEQSKKRNKVKKIIK